MQHDFSRYSCQLALPGFNEALQQQLQNAKVLIVGAGGLGCPAAQYLAAAGIGTLCIADYDTISISNLHRQILYTPKEIGLNKAFVSCKKLGQQNPLIKLHSIQKKITSQNIMEVIKLYDIILDCTDNFDTKYLLNDACVLTGKPLIYGAIYQYEGQVAIWNIIKEDGTISPNYRDLFPAVNTARIPDCADGGVMPTLAGIIGCIQATEAIKYLTNTGELLAGKVLIFNVQTMQINIIKLKKTTVTKITRLPETLTDPVITITELKEIIKNNSHDLIDVRTAQEHLLFNIGGSNIDVGKLEDDDHIQKITKPVVLYCSSGKRSGEAAKILQKKYPGKNFFSLEGGLQAWE